MKYWKTILILLLGVFLGVLALKEYRKSVKETEEEELAQKLITKDINDIKGFSIIYPETTIVTERGNWRQWFIVEPTRFTVKASRLKNFLAGLDEAKIEMVIDEPDIKLEDYGFDEGRLAIALDFNTAEDETLYFGTRSPTDEYVYVRKSGDRRVLTTLTSLERTTAVPYAKLRDNNVCFFFSSDLDSISWTHGDTTATIVRDALDHWSISYPVTADCDQMEVTKYLNYINGLLMLSVITEKADDLSEYGLDDPILSVSIYPRHNMESTTILVGKRHPEKSYLYYTKRKKYDLIFGVHREFTRKHSLPVNLLRDRVIGNFSRPEVDQIELIVEGKLIRYIKDAQNNWTMVYPKDMSVPDNDINTIFRITKFLFAQEWVSEHASPEELKMYGFENPRVIVKIKKGSVVLMEYRVGNSLPDRDDRFYAKTAHKPNIYAVSEDIWDRSTYLREKAYGE